jgi:hypothetical protein
MEGSSNSSFIPKRNPNKPRRMVGRQVYLFTVISYVVFVATIITSIGVFIYQRYVEAQMAKEVEQFNTEIGRFNEADMEKVKDFDLRLTKASSRLEHNVSLGSIFTALEQAAVQTVQMKSLNLKRSGDQGFELTALLETDNFDSSIFQREMYEQNGLIRSVNITDIDIHGVEVGADGEQSIAKRVSLSAVLGVPISSVAYQPNPASIPIFDDIPVAEAATSTVDENVDGEVSDVEDEVSNVDIDSANDSGL